jgi:4-amino-4-deoxy-L-arabinose transferase-like glycosyltransferase
MDWHDIVWIAGQWIDHAGWLHPYMGKILLSLLVTGWLTWLSIQAGCRVLSRIAGGHEMTALERTVFGAGLGLGLLSMLSLLLGAAHLWYAGLFWVLLLLLTLAIWVRPIPVRDRAPWASIVGRPGLSHLVLLLCFIVFLAGEMNPEISYDALYYHLAVPNLYRVSHQIVNVPTMMFSNFVIMIQTLYGLALTVGNAMVAKLLHGVMGGLLLLAFAAFARRYLSPGAGVMAGVIFFSIPMVGFNISTAGIDVGWTFFQFLAMFALIRSLEYEPVSGPHRSWTIVAGLFMGLAMSCRYLGWLALPLACTVIYVHRVFNEQRASRGAIQEMGWFAGAAVLVSVPWLMKNLFFHGNPIYPLGGMWLGWPTIHQEQWAAFLQDTRSRVFTATTQSWLDFGQFIVRHPWDLTMHGSSTNDFIGPVLLCLLPVLLLGRPAAYPLPQLRLYLALLWTMWLFTNTIPRYGMPALALLSVVLAESLVSLPLLRWQHRLLSLGIVVLACTNLYWQALDLHVQGGWQVVKGAVSEEEYLKQGHGSSYRVPPFAALTWMNRHLDQRAKVLFVGEARSYYLDRASIPSSLLDLQPLVRWSNEAADAETLWRRLKAEGATHLFLNYGEALLREEYQPFRWTAHGWATFQGFWDRHVRLLWFEESDDASDPRGLYVYQLLDESESNRPHAIPANPFLRWAPGGPGFR